MVKMPSKDSGYSVGSKGSSQSNGKDTPRDEGENLSWDSDSNPRKADSGTGSLSQEPVYDKKTSKSKELNVSNPKIQESCFTKKTLRLRLIISRKQFSILVVSCFVKLTPDVLFNTKIGSFKVFAVYSFVYPVLQVIPKLVD